MKSQTSQMGGKAIYGQTGTRCLNCNGNRVVLDPSDEKGLRKISCPSCAGTGLVRRIAQGEIRTK